MLMIVTGILKIVKPFSEICFLYKKKGGQLDECNVFVSIMYLILRDYQFISKSSSFVSAGLKLKIKL